MCCADKSTPAYALTSFSPWQNNILILVTTTKTYLQLFSQPLEARDERVDLRVCGKRQGQFEVVLLLNIAEVWR